MIKDRNNYRRQMKKLRKQLKKVERKETKLEKQLKKTSALADRIKHRMDQLR